MTTLFFFICAVSVVFFGVFLVGCSRPRKSRRDPVIRKLPESAAVDSAAGRRFFVYLEEQMAHFISVRGRTAAILVIAISSVSLMARAQESSGLAIDSQASGTDQSIPPAVAKQLEAMQKRIDQLEKELNDRSAAGPPLTLKTAAPVHELNEQTAPASVPAESALATPDNPEKPAPFSFADFTWLNGNSRIKEVPFDTKFFTPEIRADVDYVYDFNHPQDDTISGSSEIFRANEFQVTQLGVGGDFHWDNVQARLMTQFGMYSQTTPRNDASPARGQWQLGRRLPLHFGGLCRLPH